MSAVAERIFPLLLQLFVNTSASAVLLFILLRLFRNRTPAFRLTLCWAALLAPVVSTFTVYWFNAEPFELAALPPEEQMVWFWRVIVGGWIAGSAFGAIRFVAGFRRLSAVVCRSRRLCRSEYAGLGLSYPQDRWIPIRVSTEISSPAVYGIWKPVILVPAFRQLHPMEWRSILLHEVGHVSRNDARWNALQCFLETLFFFSPAIWWISGRIRMERECASDDYAVQQSGDALPLIDGLAKLAELRIIPDSQQTGAAGSNLALRLRRLVDGPRPKGHGAGILAVIIVLLLAIQCVIPSFAAWSDSQDVRVRVVVIQKS